MVPKTTTKLWHFHVASFSCLQMSFHPKASMKIWPCRWDSVWGPWLNGSCAASWCPPTPRGPSTPASSAKYPRFCHPSTPAVQLQQIPTGRPFGYNKDSLIICGVSSDNTQVAWSDRSLSKKIFTVNSSDLSNYKNQKSFAWSFVRWTVSNQSFSDQCWPSPFSESNFSSCELALKTLWLSSALRM